MYITEPRFPGIVPDQLSADRRKLFGRLPADFQAFLQRHNGGAVPPHQLNFLTGIPFATPSTELPSRTDHITAFLGLDPVDGEEWDDLFYFNRQVDSEMFPAGVILVARGHYGDVGISLAQDDPGAVYYQWRHYPSVADYYRERRAAVTAEFEDLTSPEAVRADAFATIERVAGSWTEFLGRFLPHESVDLSVVAGLEMMVYDKMYEQIKRRIAVHNLWVMFRGALPEGGEALLSQINDGFLPGYWMEDLRENAPLSGELYATEKPLDDNWVLDRMLDGLMLPSSRDEYAYAVLVHFAQYIGYPLVEVKRSIADYHGRKEREAKRQAPPLEEMLQDGREQGIRTIQTMYLIGIAGGGVTPEQDHLFIEVAREGEVHPEEMMFIVRHRDGLNLQGPKYAGWRDDMKEKVIRFLKVSAEGTGGTLVPASLDRAAAFFEIAGSDRSELERMLQ
ncbi:MAG: SMI1/KNR4 family protein [Bacteroidota bacterium]